MGIKVLIGIGYLLVILGIFFVAWSFRSSMIKSKVVKLIRLGEVGVILALIGGLIFIRYFYAIQKVPERILQEHLEERYKDEDFEISLNFLNFLSPNYKNQQKEQIIDNHEKQP